MIERIGGAGSSYSQAVAAPAERLFWISGQVAQDDNGRTVEIGDAGGQARFVFRKIERLLAERGGTLSDVVKVTGFITRREDFAQYALVRAEVFGPDLPASSTVVTGLLDPEWLLEIEAVAVIK